MSRSRTVIVVVCLAGMSLLVTAAGALNQTPTRVGPYDTAEGLVTELYKAVTFEAGTTPDWDKVRAMFLEQAIVVLRTSREATTLFSVDGFVKDFEAFIEKTNARQTGFAETIIRFKSLGFRDMAHVLVLYSASVPTSPRPPTQGVDSFQLIRKEGRWWIASIINELPTAESPVPEELLFEAK
ncbi:MAG: hypothetical protein AB1486_02045 [Planctomycetota bacterium]